MSTKFQKGDILVYLHRRTDGAIIYREKVVFIGYDPVPNYANVRDMIGCFFICNISNLRP